MRKEPGRPWRNAVAAGIALTTAVSFGDVAATGGVADAASSNCWDMAISVSACGGMSALVAAAKADACLGPASRAW